MIAGIPGHSISSPGSLPQFFSNRPGEPSLLRTVAALAAIAEWNMSPVRIRIRERLPKLEDVVFKGGGDAIAALLGGTAQMCSGSLPPALPHLKSGSLRCLAVTGDTRWPELPDVPTMEEVGYKDFVFAVNCVLLAPARTPPENAKCWKLKH
jgi:tripartite-type tricarboxylate transporter receptor subunit TctC